MRIFQKILSITLVIILLFGTIPIELGFALDNTTKDISINAKIDEEKSVSITKGEKGVEYNIEYMDISFGNDAKIVGNYDDIDIYVNGKKDADSFKLEPSKEGDKIRITLKDGPANGTYMHPFELRKHTLYNISIPQGFFVDSNKGKENKEINFPFVTKGEGIYKEYILKDITPVDGQDQVDYKNGTITFSFIDDIEFSSEYLNQKDKSKYIEIHTDSMMNPKVKNYGDNTSDSINNYDIDIKGNQLILKSKTKSRTFKDFANYTVRLKDNTVVLKNTKYLENGKEIYNKSLDDIKWKVFKFTTDDLVDWENTYPENNQEPVEINPLIKIPFKYPIQDFDANKITLSSDANTFAVKIVKGEDAWITPDGMMLKIDINSLYRNGENPLRKNTAYKLTIGEKIESDGEEKLIGNTLTFENDKYNDGTKKYKKPINLYFITGKGEALENPGLFIDKYTSDIQTDDITKVDYTQLDKDKNIYIHFNREIKWNNWDGKYPITSKEPPITNENAKEYFKLYIVPNSDNRKYDPEGKVYDQVFHFNGDGENIPGKLPQSENFIEDEVPIKNVEILPGANGKNSKVIKITPKYDLVNLNQYSIEFDKNIIIDNFDKKIERYKDGKKILGDKIEQLIWTCAKADKTSPNWQVNNIKAQEIKEDLNAPYKTYTLFGVPQYNSDTKPIIIDIDKEVRPNPHHDKTKPNDLFGIKLYEGYTDGDLNDKSHVDIKEYQLEYYFENGIKKTRFKVYPENPLTIGRYYQLQIDDETFVTRGDVKTDKLQLDFVVEGDKDVAEKEEGGVGIDKIVTFPNQPLSVLDFVYKEVNLSIIGYNFNEEMKDIRLVRKDDGKEIKISKEKIKFQDVTKIIVTIDGKLAEELAKEINVGEYEIWMYINDIHVAKKGTFTIKSKGRPKVIEEKVVPNKYDNEEDKDKPPSRYDELKLHTEGEGDNKVYYLTVVFYDYDGTIKNRWKNRKIFECATLFVAGTDKNLVDETKEILSNGKMKNEFHIYIPLKGELSPGQKYIVTIKDNIVYNDILGNEEYIWTFFTNFIPVPQDVIVGSVVEDYDEDEPVILEGDMFYKNDFNKVNVYFRDIAGEKHEAEHVEIKEIIIDEETQKKQAIAYVYLPSGSKRLDVGLYDIIVRNDDKNHQKDLVYGVFSVVREGDKDHIPNEEYRIKEDRSFGEIRSDLKVSEDTLLLSSSDTDENELEINLDELMGEYVLTRKIKYDGDEDERIGMLKTKSKWANVTLYGLTLDPYAEDEKIIVRLGRTEPSVTQTLKRKLRGRGLKSDFIQVSGENFKINNVKLSIPLKYSNGKNITVLRYDEFTRNFYEQLFTVNLVDQKVEFLSNYKGIFVVVAN